MCGLVRIDAPELRIGGKVSDLVEHEGDSAVFGRAAARKSILQDLLIFGRIRELPRGLSLHGTVPILSRLLIRSAPTIV